MAPFATIYSYPENLRVKRAEVLAAFNGLELAHAEFTMGVTNQTPEFLAKFPLAKVPTMETADGVCLSEGVAICAHIAGSGPMAEQLLGATVADRSQVWRWSLFAETELASNALPIVFSWAMKLFPRDPATYDKSVAGFQRALLALEADLKSGKSFLVGGKVSMADVMVAATLAFASGFLLDEAMIKDAPNVAKYMERISAIPEFKNVFGEFKPAAARIAKD